jgi:hypothetical protein
MGAVLMAVIKLVEDYSVRQLRADVRDSLMMAGEQAILLQTYHAGDPDVVKCPECGDDIYESPEASCTSCYGTMFQGGVRNAMKVWALFGDHQVSEQLSQRGIYEPDHRSIQFEAFPLVTEHDVVVRVRNWDDEGNPAVVEGYYILDKVDRRSLRTGNRFGQYSWDVVGQKAQVAELPEKLHGITSYPIVGQSFFESVDLSPATAITPASALVEPDVKVIYFPFNPDPGGPVAEEPITAITGLTFTQSIPAAIWTIHHTLGYEPNVSIIVGDEEVEAEVEYPNNSVVVINFGIPVAGSARLT